MVINYYTYFSCNNDTNFLFLFSIFNTKILDDFKNTNLPLYNFLFNKWYIDELYEISFVKPAKSWFLLLEKGDVGTIDRFGPDGVSKLIKIISNSW